MESLSLREMEDEARRHLDPAVYDFFAGGAGDEVTVRANAAAFARIGLVPRVLRGGGTRELAVTLLGRRAAQPVIVAPTAFHRLAHPDGELATARAAAKAGVIMVVSMASVVFGERCPPEARALIVANADDVVTALKGCRLRHMDRRDRLTRFLVGRLEAGGLPHELPAGLSLRERALYLQGTFFNTAIVQTSEAMAHLLMVLAQHPETQVQAIHDDRYLDRVMEETFRLYPLFGVAHRITTGEIAVSNGVTLAEGSVLCFNYPAFHRVGFDDPDRFDPSRWERLAARDANHIPFGVAANRPCPAWRLAPITMKVAARVLLRRFALSTSASHTRSMPNRGPCLLVPRDGSRGLRAAPLARSHLWVRDRWEDLARSVVQLVLGTYMVRDARRQRLCQRHFEAVERDSEPAGHLPVSADGP